MDNTTFASDLVYPTGLSCELVVFLISISISQELIPCRFQINDVGVMLHIPHPPHLKVQQERRGLYLTTHSKHFILRLYGVGQVSKGVIYNN